MTNQHPKIKNDRLYRAATELLEGEGNVKQRVVNACRLLRGISANEVPMELRLRIDEVLKQAGEKPALRNPDGDIISGRDRFYETATNKRNSTYVKYAREIYDIYWQDLHS